MGWNRKMAEDRNHWMYGAVENEIGYWVEFIVFLGLGGENLLFGPGPTGEAMAQCE